jgi:hypothetical protein
MQIKVKAKVGLQMVSECGFQFQVAASTFGAWQARGRNALDAGASYLIVGGEPAPLYSVGGR